MQVEAEFSGPPEATFEIRAQGDGELGGWAMVTVSFDETGKSEPVRIRWEANVDGDIGVGIYEGNLNLEFRPPEGEWMPFGEVKTRIFLTAAPPGTPWTVDPDQNNQPWIEALELACEWAKGARTPEEVSEKITRSLIDSGKFKYDAVNGNSFYTTLMDEFELDEFIRQWKTGEGLGWQLNCTDCAGVVSTLSNLLGAQLQVIQMRYNFAVRNIQAIGFEEWAPPFDGKFAYHEVAWSGETAENGGIYDACCYLEGEEQEPLLAVNKPFQSEEGMDYLRLIATEEGIPSCKIKSYSLLIRSILT